eukprot:124897-Pelagomonas_calceolata.AAC.1
MPTWKCEIIIRTVDIVKETQHCEPSVEATVPIQTPEVFTYETACIYNTNCKFVCMLTIERLQNLLEAYEDRDIHLVEFNFALMPTLFPLWKLQLPSMPIR